MCVCVYMFICTGTRAGVYEKIDVYSYMTGR